MNKDYENLEEIKDKIEIELKKQKKIYKKQLD